MNNIKEPVPSWNFFFFFLTICVSPNMFSLWSLSREILDRAAFLIWSWIIFLHQHTDKLTPLYRKPNKFPWENTVPSLYKVICHDKLIFFIVFAYSMTFTMTMETINGVNRFYKIIVSPSIQTHHMWYINISAINSVSSKHGTMPNSTCKQQSQMFLSNDLW